MGTIKTTNIESISGSGTVTLGTSGETFAVGTGVTQTIAVNTPNFKVSNTGDQSLSNATFTKLTFDTEVFDSDSAFASDKFTVPSGKAGKYAVTFQAFMEGSNDIRVMRGYVYKNGSALSSMQTRLAFNSNLLDAGTPVGFIVSGVLNLSVSDYLEAYVYIYNTAAGTYKANAVNNVFQGYKIIE